MDQTLDCQWLQEYPPHFGNENGHPVITEDIGLDSNWLDYSVSDRRK